MTAIKLLNTLFCAMAILVLSLSMTACDNHAGHNGDADHKDDKAQKDHGDDKHDGHKGDEHADEGERHELGKVEIAGMNVAVAVFGEIKAGAEGVLDIEVEGGSPTAVRAWVGVESGKGSLKTKVPKSGEEYHGHIEVPSTLPEGSALWIEIETGEGEKAAKSFSLN